MQGSRLRTAMTMDNTLQFRHVVWSQFWKIVIAKPGTNGVHQRYCYLPLGGANNRHLFLAQHRRTGAECNTVKVGEICFLWLCLLNTRLASKLCHATEQFKPLSGTGSPRCPPVSRSPHCSFHRHRRTALWSLTASRQKQLFQLGTFTASTWKMSSLMTVEQQMKHRSHKHTAAESRSLNQGACGLMT